MYIKLDADMDLAITVNEPIYRGDNLSRKIIYLVPKKIGEVDTIAATLFLNYIRADGVGDVDILQRLDTPYNDDYLQYTFPVNCKLTRFAGQVCTWIQVYSGDPASPVTAKSGECLLYVQDAKDMDDYLSDQQVSALYRMSQTMQTTLDAFGEELKKKADNIVFHEEDNTIQLTAEGTPVGDRIKISTVTGAVVTDAGITTDGELILKFSDGTMKNLGVVVDEGGAVYVPHISDRKILSFTIEDKPQGVPDPVDLNPFDEWSGIGDDEIKTDYIWESL